MNFKNGTAKAIREKFRKEVQDQVEDLMGNTDGQKAYWLEMKLRRDKLHKMDRVPCDTNFVNKNTNTTDNIFEAQYKTALHRVNEE